MGAGYGFPARRRGLLSSAVDPVAFTGTAAGRSQPIAPLKGQPPWLPGFSHVLHGLAGMRMALVESPGLANTDNSLFRSVEWHCGHSGTVLDLTSASNAWPQPLQAYS